MIIDSQKKIELIEEYSNPLNLHEDDEISLKLENFYDEKEHLDDFDIFNGGYQQDEEVVFYSNHELEMNDEYGRM